MKRLKRRDFLKAAALASMGGVFTACQPRASEVAKSVVTEGEPAPKASVKIRNIVWAATADMIPLYESFTQTFSERFPHIEVEYIFVPNPQYVARLTTMEAAGDPPEVCMPIGGAINYWRAPDYNKWLDLRPLIDRDNYDLDDFHEASIFSATDPFRGSIDGLPVQLFAGFTVYNKDLFAKAGVEEPPHEWGADGWGYEEFLELAMRLTIDENGRSSGQSGFDPNNIVQFGYWHSSYDPTWGWFFGGEAIRTHPTDRQNVYVGEDPFIEGAQFWQDAVYKHRIMPYPYEAEEFQGTLASPFHTGKIAMASGMTWNVASYIPISDFEVDFAATFHGPVRDRYINRLCMDQGSMFTGGKHHDEAWEWIKFCSSPEMSFRFSVDLRECLPARKSAIPRYGERLAMRMPDVDGDVVAESLGYSWYEEYWTAPVEWDEVYNPARDKIRLEGVPPAEVLPEAQRRVQILFDEYYAQFPDMPPMERIKF